MPNTPWPCPKCGQQMSKRAYKQCGTCQQAERAANMKNPKQVLTPKDRHVYGCIVTFLSSRGETLVLHRTGTTLDALQECLEDTLTADPTYRVVTISTPQTIYEDLKGKRAKNRPERPLLGRLGRLEMAHPCTIASTDKRHIRIEEIGL